MILCSRLNDQKQNSWQMSSQNRGIMLKAPCPTCKKEIEWSDQNSYRPFCCARCKLIDLGAWADGSYAIPDKPADDEPSHDEQ